MSLFCRNHVGSLLCLGSCLGFVTSYGGSQVLSKSWNPRYLRPIRYSIHEIDEARAHLQNHGFVVYRDAVSTDEVNNAMSMYWDFFEKLGLGITRNFPSSLTHRRFGNLFGNGLFTGCGAGHSSLLWFLRGLPRMRQIFENVWATKDLLVSFDGIVTFRKRDAFKPRERWYHMDLNPLRVNGTGIPMVQGFVNFIQSSENSGGLVLVPGSHKMYNDIASRTRELLLQRHLQDGEADHYMHLGGVVGFDDAASILHLEAGDVVVWDGRTVHCNARPQSAANWSVGPVRAGVLITMAPRREATPEVLAARREAVCKGVTLTHWPNEFVPVDQPVGGSRSLAPLSCLYHGPPPLDDNQLELIGLTDSERNAWLQGAAWQCPSTLYPSAVPRMKPLWSSQINL